MSYLRFSPPEHQAICDICLSLNLNRCRPQSLKRILAASLTDALPELAGRIAGLRQQEMQLLHDHLRDQRGPPKREELSAAELSLFDAAFGGLLVQARFLRPLKGTIVEHFRQHDPELAAKLGRLSDERFEALCEQVKLLRDRGP